MIDVVVVTVRPAASTPRRNTNPPPLQKKSYTAITHLSRRNNALSSHPPTPPAQSLSCRHAPPRADTLRRWHNYPIRARAVFRHYLHTCNQQDNLPPTLTSLKDKIRLLRISGRPFFAEPYMCGDRHFSQGPKDFGKFPKTGCSRGFTTRTRSGSK